MNNETKDTQSIATDQLKPIDPENETTQLSEQDLNKVAGGGQVVGSSSNIKNNIVPVDPTKIIGSSSNIKNN